MPRTYKVQSKVGEPTYKIEVSGRAPIGSIRNRVTMAHLENAANEINHAIEWGLVVRVTKVYGGYVVATFDNAAKACKLTDKASARVTLGYLEMILIGATLKEKASK